MATVNGKEVLYVDADDEITTVIDKVGHAEAKIIALVLPKRASVFQSVVNMKLLKRRADNAKKHVVLITSEAGLLPLAGMSGLHVASTLQSKPEIPEAGKEAAAAHLPVDDSVAMNDDFNPHEQAGTPVGQLNGDTAQVISPTGAAATEDAIELDNTDKKPPTTPPASAGKTGTGKSSGKKGLKIPDFFRFRKRLIFIVLGLILLIVLYILMFRVLPAAAVIIRTKGKDINTSISLTLDTGTKQLDQQTKKVPATLQQQQKTYTQQAPATGQKNLGSKASGNVMISARKCGGNPFESPSLSAGSGVTSGGASFITQQGATFHGTGTDGAGCYTYTADGNTPIQAVQPGASSNVNNAQFSVSGNADWGGSGSTSGGTDNIVKVVQQSDIDAAKAKMNASSDQTAMKQQLKQALESSNLYAIQSSFSANPSSINVSAQADQQADNVTVTETINYAMYGAKKKDLHDLVVGEANKQIDTAKQSILNDGLDGATFTVSAPGSNASLPLTMNVTAVAGPHLDADMLKRQIAGKKSGDAKPIIQNTPGVTGVNIDYSPFWVSSLPHNANKITIVFQKDNSSGQ